MAAIVLSSCVQDDEFDVPSVTIQDQDSLVQGTEITIGALRDLLAQEQNNNQNDILDLGETDTYLIGYVISSDEGGNFFEELIIQDKAENPTAGVRILADVNPLFTSFELGRKVFVKLNGLTVGIDGGVVSLGVRDDESLGKIAESRLFDYVIRDDETETLVPLPISINDFTRDKTNLFVRIENVQFGAEEVLGDDPKTFAGEPDDEFDGERNLISCSDGLSTVFSTSTFADFKSVLLPTGAGSINAILSRDFFDEFFIVTVNDPSFIDFGTGERCDLCGDAESRGDTVLFSDFFETQTEGSPISGNGWTNYIEAGTETWEAFFDDGTNASLGISARILSFNSEDESTIGWLVTPEIDFDAQAMETLEFKTSTSFADGSQLLVLFSQDWDGVAENIPAASWGPVPAARIAQNSDFFGDWIESGLVDLSCILGTGHVAFKYIGSGNPDNDGTYELDEIEIRSETVIVPPGEGVDCGVADTVGNNELFSDFFENQTPAEPISNNGWTNYSEAGAQLWEAYAEAGTNPSLGISARVGSFMSGEESTISWLITPQIDLGAQDGETIDFKTSTNFPDGSELEVLFSNDWDGTEANITSANWEVLLVATVAQNEDPFGDWIFSENVKLDCVNGTGYVAFKYTGSGNPDFDGTYELDEITINAN
ncbi:DUF5689 domain-containing protein [Cochleicola gelatinilyticus]|uniref:DUF5689 domain-containing protein n=1 Tax=Cochleicola gelatinilyticus TaxID=1763537 RepID=A0A167IWV0_9FLAO|nr:DUF5689 domain-containing protein [Cochleicola gelatinilyticus]OAB80092.1 hypothetical protein ULVI_04960 [Cochleicola gelatinilyticus]